MLEIDLDSDEEGTTLDTTMANEDSETSDEEDDERLWDTPVAGPEQEEDNLGDFPIFFRTMWVLSPNGLQHKHHPHCHQTLTL